MKAEIVSRAERHVGVERLACCSGPIGRRIRVGVAQREPEQDHVGRLERQMARGALRDTRPRMPSGTYRCCVPHTRRARNRATHRRRRTRTVRAADRTRRSRRVARRRKRSCAATPRSARPCRLSRCPCFGTARRRSSGDAACTAVDNRAGTAPRRAAGSTSPRRSLRPRARPSSHLRSRTRATAGRCTSSARAAHRRRSPTSVARSIGSGRNARMLRRSITWPSAAP